MVATITKCRILQSIALGLTSGWDDSYGGNKQDIYESYT